MTTDPGGPDRDEILIVVTPTLATPISLTPMAASQMLTTERVAIIQRVATPMVTAW